MSKAARNWRNALIDIGRIQGRLILLAGVFVGVYSIALTISPAVRARSWQTALRWDHWFGFVVWVFVFYSLHRQVLKRMPECDPFLLPCAGLLSGWGMMSIWRLVPEFGLRQSIWLLIAGILVFAGLRLPSFLDILRRYKYVWLTGSLVLAATTLFLGTNPTGYGPRMWLGCCGVYLQPSEPLKLLLIAYLAAYLAERYPFLAITTYHRESGFSGQSTSMLPLLAPTFVMTGLALSLLLVQRDLGTASIFLLLYAALVYAATGRKSILVIACFGLLAAGVAGYWLFDVVRIRVEAWLNPWLDPSGRSYQIVQSLIAVANGGWLGRGPGVGNPALVPLAHSDLIFAAIAEEEGLAGVVGMLAVFGLITARGLRVATRLEGAIDAKDVFRRNLAAGITAYMVGQALMISGGSLRLFPLTGITLPFVSYGGSSLVVSFLALLALLEISSEGFSQLNRITKVHASRNLSGILMAGLLMVALIAGWWVVYRAPALVGRTDNARRSIADRFVLRGAILDRNGRAINLSNGRAGSFTRRYLVPSLNNVVGYIDPTYGQSGIEESLDGTLRGLEGNPWWNVWWNQLLYGQPPPGLNIRLSLDIDLQLEAGQWLKGRKGAVVMLNAESGEILVMASEPGFDANRLEKEWDLLVDDRDSPLLNRAVLGRYPLGALETQLFSGGFSSLGLAAEVPMRLESGGAGFSRGGSIWVSPMQAAMAGAALSAEGLLLGPVLAAAYQSPDQDWVLFPSLQPPRQIVAKEIARETAESHAIPRLGIWEMSELVKGEMGTRVVWYLGGTLPDWPGAPVAIAVLLEGDDLPWAMQTGQALLALVMGGQR